MSDPLQSRASIKIGNRNITIELLDSRLRRIAMTIGWMIIIAGAVAGLAFVWPFLTLVFRSLMPFVVALVFAYIFNPIVSFVQRRARLSRIGGVLFLYLLFIVAISIFFAILLPILITQIKSAWAGISDFLSGHLSNKPALMDFWDGMKAWLAQHGIVVEEVFKQALTSEGMSKAAQSAAASGFKIVSDALGLFFTIMISLIGSVMFIVLVILVNIYLLLDFSKIGDVIQIIIPAKSREKTFDILAKIDHAVGGFIRGMLIDAFLVGLLTFIGLYILGLKQYALLIGIFAGLGTLVPYMGPITGGGPALLYVIFSDAYKTTQERFYFALGVLALTVAIQMVEGFIFQPKIVGKAAQLHPLAVLFALAFGANFGILGMIIAVPVACIIRVLVKEFYWDKREFEWKMRTGKRFLGEWDNRPAHVPSAAPPPAK